MRGLAPLIERIFTPASVFPWLNSLQTVSDAASLRSSQDLLAVLLKNARQLNASSRLLSSSLREKEGVRNFARRACYCLP